MTEERKIREKYKLINAVLLAMRFKPRYHGFFYLREIIILIITDKNFASDNPTYNIKDIIPKALYIDVAKKLSVSIENIEKSIRVAIQRMWETAEPGLTVDILGEKYTFPQKKPTNTQIMFAAYVIVDKILKKNKNL